jgi:hypothetical protein
MSVTIRPRTIISTPLVATCEIHVGILRGKDNSFSVGVVSKTKGGIVPAGKVR